MYTLSPHSASVKVLIEFAGWSGKAIRQKKALVPSAVPPLDILEDDDLADNAPGVLPAPASSVRNRQCIMGLLRVSC